MSETWVGSVCVCGDIMGVMGRGRRDKRNGLTGMRDHLHMSTSAIALEQRFMFDAAGVATAVDAVVHDPAADALFDTADHSVDQALLAAAAQAAIAVHTGEVAELPATERVEIASDASAVTLDTPTYQVIRAADGSLNDGRSEVVFIDTSIEDWQTLADGVKSGMEVVLLDGSSDGLAQMAAWAEGKSGYDAIHILSHGTEGKYDSERSRSIPRPPAPGPPISRRSAPL